MANRLAGNLLFLRKKAKKNQAVFSNSLEIKRSTYANWESGHSEPPISALQHISSNLGISIDDLINTDLSAGKVSKDIPENEKGKVLGKVSGKVSEKYPQGMSEKAIALAKWLENGAPKDEEQIVFDLEARAVKGFAGNNQRVITELSVSQINEQLTRLWLEVDHIKEANQLERHR